MLRVAGVGVLITSFVGRKRRAAPNGWCYVPWRYLDQLADALRELGVDPHAPNLGQAVHDVLRARLDEGIRQRAEGASS
jgi:hypothetical protein